MAHVTRIGTHEQQQQIRAIPIGDPGLGTVHAVEFFVGRRARADGSEVRTAVRFTKRYGRQDLTVSEPWQPCALLLFGAVIEDEVSCDFGSNAERANSDIAAR